MTRINESTRIDNKIIHKELSYDIMEAAFEVYNTLGPGYSEGIYEAALAKEFRDRNIKYEKQKLIEVWYKGEKMGEYRLDIVVEGKIILELKAVSELNKIFEAQILSYLKATGLKLGILLNFGGKKVEYKRIVD
ncbi:GxxExxY protein [candidate division WOR-3 bacterium JGI_Cruoil_03_44_89]|uniref:GxxExxY protein n=1 Tax=candidate division WOR-3 bacterium JGI_Cruoil_03_44_89 TaxID=1973748 RepID=A0A235BXG5_UNCW3|nr:MAG: GxxExxY protein [candidate division WOR-3 bacterium JGI_Cruoil_03_44_89]